MILILGSWLSELACYQLCCPHILELLQKTFTNYYTTPIHFCITCLNDHLDLAFAGFK